MPAAVIPNILSFIWVGSVLPDRYADNIFMWASMNRRYAVHVWVEPHCMDESALALLAAAEKKLTVPLLKELQILDAETGKVAVIERMHDEPLHIHVDSIGAIEPVVDPTLMVEELTVWKNYGSVSDILRLGVLNTVGGIYMDTDTYPDRRALPVDMYAPQGLLLCCLESSGEPELVNAIMAAPKGSEEIKTFAQSFEQSYATEYPVVAHGVRRFTLANQMRLQAVLNCREVLQHFPQEGFVTDTTTDIEGDPFPIQQVIHGEGYTAAERDLLYSVKDQFEELFIYRSTCRGEQAMSNIETRVITLQVIYEYSFQHQSGYFPILKNESSWKK